MELNDRLQKQSQWLKDEGESEEQSNITSEPLNNATAYYPIAVGNRWTYDFGGQQMTNEIESEKSGVFISTNSLNPVASLVKKINGEYFSDSLEKDNMQMFLKDVMTLGDNWEVKFKINGLDCIYIFTVKEVLASKTIIGKEYKDVVMVEMDSNYVVNGAKISMNAFIQNYYAKGVGVVLTKTSGVIGNKSYSLLSFELK